MQAIPSTLLPNDYPVVYHRTNQRSRSLRMVLSPKGEIILTTPPRFPLPKAIPFLLQSRDWIEKQLALHRRRTNIVNEQTMLFLGKQLRVVAVRHANEAVILGDDEIQVHPVDWSSASMAKAIVRWLKTQAEEFVAARTALLARKTGHRYSSIQLRDQVTRWGSCSSQGNLQLNWRLIQAPQEVIDYVIMHEMAHLMHMDHSQRFWNYVEKMDPHYTDHKRWLRLHGAALHQTFEFDPEVCSRT